ncbi:hypothetical protein [Streptomyces mesophilus]|uniref:hypothetical protein n=1 Tax=Streptomyces mesophilus TaxID=1775132 RepID=UPI003EBFE619
MTVASKKPRTDPPAPAKCKPCKGTGEVSRTVRVGRKHRPVGEQTGMCLSCFGTGHAPTE